MIKHVVCWKIKEFAEGKSKSENLQIMQEMLKSLKSLPMVQEIEVGMALKEAGSSNFDIVLLTVFKNSKDLHAYQVHPEHLKVADFVGKIRDSRACVDFEF
jgi:hypothetical protein